ncbi:MAG: CBS domain-containing protein [Candidatus Omnitrophica bacterium]|nr:CBS domain-containing protein [Candidatus Omnitrophota bacterium]
MRTVSGEVIMREKKDRVKDLSKMLKSVKASDIMTKDVIVTKKSATLSEIAEIMIEKRISGLPVMSSSGKVLGIITENDLFMVMDMVRSGDIPHSGRNAKKGPTVDFAMSTKVHKIKTNTNLEDIIVLMKYKNAHTLPVMKGKKMAGVIGRRDVFKKFYSIVKKLHL